MDIKEQLGLLRKLFICRRDLIDPSGINMECTQLSASPPGETIIHFSLGWGVNMFLVCHSDIDGDFKKELLNLVPALLAPENLVEKEIGGVKITCRDLLHYFKVSLLVSKSSDNKRFQSKLPKKEKDQRSELLWDF